MSKAARLPQVPGAGVIKPTPNHVAKRCEGCFKFGKFILLKMIPAFK